MRLNVVGEAERSQGEVGRHPDERLDLDDFAVPHTDRGRCPEGLLGRHDVGRDEKAVAALGRLVGLACLAACEDAHSPPLGERQLAIQGDIDRGAHEADPEQSGQDRSRQPAHADRPPVMRSGFAVACEGGIEAEIDRCWLWDDPRGPPERMTGLAEVLAIGRIGSRPAKKAGGDVTGPVNCRGRTPPVNAGCRRFNR